MKKVAGFVRLARDSEAHRAAVPLQITKLDYALLAAVAAFYLLFGLGAYGLLNNNEGLYAEIAREIMDAGSAAIPHLNGVPYLEKPPLLIWLLSAVYAAFGQSETVSRLVPVSGQVLLTAALVIFGRHIRQESMAWLAALILNSSVVFVVLARTIVPDILLTALLSAGLLLFYAWHRSGKKALLVASYSFVGLSVMAKGFLALLLAPAIMLLFGMFAARTWKFRELAYPPAIFAFLLIVLPWHVALALKDREFAWFYIVNEQILRYLDLREPKDYYTGPWWYYAPRILAYLFPWTVFLPALLWRSRGARLDPSGLETFLWVWFAATLVFFSVSLAKANYYMMLGMPPLALLLAAAIERAAGRARDRLLPWLASSAVLMAAAALMAVDAGILSQVRNGISSAVVQLGDDLKLRLWFYAAAAAAAVLCFALRYYRAALYATAVSTGGLLVFFVITMQAADAHVSARELARLLDSRYPAVPVYLYQDFEGLSSLPFYLKREIPIVDSKSNDLLFGKRYAPESVNFVSAQQVKARASDGAIAIVVHRERLERFRSEFGMPELSPAAQVGDVTVFVSRKAGLPAGK